MKWNKYFKIFFIELILILILMSCKDKIVDPPPNNNYILNGSFEEDNMPTLNGWRLGNPNLAELINEAPQNGGSWSLQLTSDWAPTTAYVYTSVSNINSGDIVELSAFVRVKDHVGGSGIIKLISGKNINENKYKINSSSDTLWNQITISDTLDLEPGDSLWVVLSAPITEIVPFKQLFDLVRLEKL